jgi:hypothetical protein
MQPRHAWLNEPRYIQTYINFLFASLLRRSLLKLQTRYQYGSLLTHITNFALRLSGSIEYAQLKLVTFNIGIFAIYFLPFMLIEYLMVFRYIYKIYISFLNKSTLKMWLFYFLHISHGKSRPLPLRIYWTLRYLLF